MSVYFLITLTTLITPGLLSKFLNGNFSNLESVIVNATGFLGIIEMGIGTGIVCKLYRPIQEQDNLKIALILNFYKKSYMIIAAVVFCAGLVMSAIFFNLLIDKDTRNSFYALCFGCVSNIPFCSQACNDYSGSEELSYKYCSRYRSCLYVCVPNFSFAFV